ncbi:MAG: DUF1501 domain-containing protein [Pirellulaceae bacterium]|nr:DUF1501 domain-containing protein [Pirellulaceae bacterium]HJN11802.1 DUF1501 domain-containing protein [Pirellulaceae bacterium]
MFKISRRQMLQTTSSGFGYLAFSALAAEASDKVYKSPLATKEPHFEPRAKHVIFLCMRGGPSHVDTFDHKPMLKAHAGKAPADALGLNNQKGRKLKPSPWEFRQHGESGLMISDLYPQLCKHADDLCLLNSMHTDVPNHPQALVQLHTGSFQFVRPSVGAWVLYGLGTESQELPGFITIKPPARLGGAQNYGSSFLPAVYQGTRIGQPGQALKDARIGNIKNPGYSVDLQRKQVSLLQSMNRSASQRNPSNSQLDGVIESYELGFRMQTSIPKLMDLSEETPETFKLYGVGENATDDFGRQCLMARRFVEAGVRYVELTHEGWDQHKSLRDRLGKNCLATDQPIAALLTDLKQRDMLKDTIVMWGGEFGRTPAVRNDDGRDHNATGFSMWMAGGGVKGGMRYGATDDFGIAAAVDKFHIHDLHATTLHLLGLDHTKLTYRYAGRDFRLTNVAGRVARDIIA